MNRRLLVTALIATLAFPGAAMAQRRPFPDEDSLLDDGRPGRGRPSERGRGRGDRPPERSPSSDEIMNRLDAAPQRRMRREDRVTVREFTRRPDLRRAAPSIDIQTINFEFGSAQIHRSQYGKIEQIADALESLTRRRRGARFLIEGHTDAVGSAMSNQILSEQRAETLRRVLVREFGIPARALESVGYGKEYLLVPTPYEDWRNRRVTLRRIDEFVR